MLALLHLASNYGQLHLASSVSGLRWRGWPEACERQLAVTLLQDFHAILIKLATNDSKRITPGRSLILLGSALRDFVGHWPFSLA